MNTKIWVVILLLGMVALVIILNILKKLPSSVIKFLVFLGIMAAICLLSVFAVRKLEGGV